MRVGGANIIAPPRLTHKDEKEKHKLTHSCSYNCVIVGVTVLAITLHLTACSVAATRIQTSCMHAAPPHPRHRCFVCGGSKTMPPPPQTNPNLSFESKIGKILWFRICTWVGGTGTCGGGPREPPPLPPNKKSKLIFECKIAKNL